MWGLIYHNAVDVDIERHDVGLHPPPLAVAPRIARFEHFLSEAPCIDKQLRYASFQPWGAFLGPEADQIPFRGLNFSKSEKGVSVEGF
jgi:hypothetical protein